MEKFDYFQKKKKNLHKNMKEKYDKFTGNSKILSKHNSEYE